MAAKTVSPKAGKAKSTVAGVVPVRGSSAPGKLTAVGAAARKAPGYLADGGNLYLRVAAAGSKSWSFVYTLRGKTREHGLGSFYDVSLAEARELAREARNGLTRGIDPIEQRQSERAQRDTEASNRITFSAAAARYIASHRSGWKSAKHADQWESTLETYAGPVFGSLPVSAVTMGHVLRMLEPIWSEKAETAGRVRGRVESVLDWATGRGYRSGPNPAAWRGNLDAQLPAPSKVKKVEHHAAMAIDDMPSFMVALRKRDSISARALEFTILTAARSGEVLGATWSEIDLEAGVWTVPAERMKLALEHRKPLSRRALEILRELGPGDGHVFPGARAGKPLSTAAMHELLKPMAPGLTVHGFRSTFRDWAGERTNHAREVCEQALAHRIGDKAEQSYARGDLFTKRVKLMQSWESFTQKAYLDGGGTLFALVPLPAKRKQSA